MRRHLALLLLSLAAISLRADDQIQLKGNSSLTGKILAEKKDQIVVDLGYTVMIVPRNQIAKISRDKAAGAAAPAGEAVELPVEKTAGFYSRNRTQPAELSVRDWVKKIGEGVVQVRTPAGLGSGFFLNEEGYLVTNFHVVEGETQITVEVYHQPKGQLERRSYRHVRIVALNKFKDLALLKIEDEDAPKFVPVAIGETDTLAVGESVFAIGSPLGLERTVTEGIVSTKTRIIGGELYLQTSAQINPGNSGGPLFNLHGEVVGVINMKSSIGEGLGFAIPADELRYFLDHRDAYAYDNDNPANPYKYLEPVRKVKRDAATAPKAGK